MYLSSLLAHIYNIVQVFELRFNISTLAEILSIPISKTLLRRHLSMRFQELIGNDLQTRKNQYERSPNCQPLTVHTKIKVKRKINRIEN